MINLIFGSTYFTTSLTEAYGEAVWQFQSLKLKTKETVQPASLKEKYF